tara:strand:+ start:4077 stop:4661 length:585 start_codon:yes stop_codon:yes gene_type:complete
MKRNTMPRIKGSKKSSKDVIVNQKDFDKSCKYTIEYRKGTRWNQSTQSTYRYMSCKKCGEMDLVAEYATAVTCWKCVQKMVDPPVFKSSLAKTGRPAGWHFMAVFVDKDGNVFHKGKEQPDLKGTLKPTKIKTKKRFNKKEKLRLMQNANAQLFELKKKLKNAKFKKDIKKIEVQMRKFQRIAAGKIPKSLRQG